MSVLIYSNVSFTLFYSDSTQSFTAGDVILDFRYHLSDILSNVVDFARMGGATVLNKIALAPHRTDEEKIDTIIQIKRFAGVPVREPVDKDLNGKFLLGFPRDTLTPLEMENALRYVVGLRAI